MMEAVIRGGSVLLGGEWIAADLPVHGGHITEAAHPAAQVIDATGLLVVPGFVDLQCNGGLGIDLAREPERIWELAAALPRWGVTAWLPTIVTTPAPVTERALAALAAGPPDGWVGADPIGLHLEGPFLAPAKKGAHDERRLLMPSRGVSRGWSREAGVALVTMAPELEGALGVIAELADRGVVVSLGHSAAMATEAVAGVDAGATWVTHLFNAMAPLHHREPGLAGVALTDRRVHVGLIADGIHVHPTAVALAQRSLGARLTLVTDAVGALGLSAGTQRFGRAEVTVGDDGVRLADGTLAGSNLSMDQAVRNLVAFSGCSTAEALFAASTAPAAVLADSTRGELLAGRRADAVLLDEHLGVVATLVAGQVVHDAR